MGDSAGVWHEYLEARLLCHHACRVAVSAPPVSSLLLFNFERRKYSEKPDA